MRDYDVQMSAPTQPRKSYLPGTNSPVHIGVRSLTIRCNRSLWFAQLGQHVLP